MEFGYPTHFDGCRFGIFNFATQAAGGYVDFDYFEVGDTQMRDAPSDHEHNYVDTVTAPTCLASGYTTATCSVCGRSYKHDYTDALGHDFDDGVITIAPTTESTGLMTYTCRRCGATKTKKLPKEGSKLPPDVDFTDPGSADQFEIRNQASAAVEQGTGLALVCTTDAFEDCKEQLSGSQATTPKDVVVVPVSGLKK